MSSNARLVQQALRQVFQEQAGVQVLDTDVPAIEAYPRAATRGLPVHRVEYRQPAGRTARGAGHHARTLAGELFPAWRSALRWSPAGPMREGQPWRARMNWRAAASGCAR